MNCFIVLSLTVIDLMPKTYILLLSLSIAHLACKLPACSGDILATATANGTGHALAVQVVAEVGHAFVTAGAQFLDAGYHVVADEVDSHVLVGQQLTQFLGMLDVIIEPLPADVFHRQAALVGKVVVAQHLHNVGDGVEALDGHHRGALLLDGVVDAHGDVDAGLLTQDF